MRKITFAEGEFYHIYNRGVEKRDIFSDTFDIGRFFRTIQEFNTPDPLGSLYEHSRLKNDFTKSSPKSKKLVEFVAYCLNPNHYHFFLTPLCDKGVEKFMHKVSTGYTNYFNEKYKRSGALFQGRYKAVHVASNEHLLHLSVYVNLNNQFGSSTPKLSKSSWEEYMNLKAIPFCLRKDIILDQFASPKEYEEFARSSLEGIKVRKREDKEFEKLLVD